MVVAVSVLGLAKKWSLSPFSSRLVALIATIMLVSIVKKLKYRTMVSVTGVVLFTIIRYSCDSSANQVSITISITSNFFDVFLAIACYLYREEQSEITYKKQ